MRPAPEELHQEDGLPARLRVEFAIRLEGLIERPPIAEQVVDGDAVAGDELGAIGLPNGPPLNLFYLQFVTRAVHLVGSVTANF